MPTAVLLAWSSPVSPESRAEFEKWYDETHIPEVTAEVPGVIGAQRFLLTDPADGTSNDRFLTIYQLDTDDLQGAAAALGAAGQGGRLTMTSVMDVSERPPVLEWYQAITKA